MKLVTLLGAILITFALLSYGIGFISIQRFKIITSGVLIFLSLGVLLDIVAVSLMIAGAKTTPFTWHGLIGYSASVTMIINLILVWQIYIKKGMYSKIRKSVITYSKFAFGWWLITYITGSLMVLWL